MSGRGRFGPFVKHKSLYANIPKAEDPAAITLERAIELIPSEAGGRGGTHPESF